MAEDLHYHWSVVKPFWQQQHCFPGEVILFIEKKLKKNILKEKFKPGQIPMYIIMENTLHT